MATVDVADTDLIIEVARGMVAETAPEELPLYGTTSAAYRRDPDRAIRPGSAGDDLLGFGDAVAFAVAPVAIAMATEVVRFLGDELRKALKEQGATAVSAAIRRLFGRLGLATGPATDSATGPTKAADVPALSPQQLAEVRRRALAEAHRFRLPAAQAHQLADSLVAQLATGAP
jgi:hypothetical protein